MSSKKNIDRLFQERFKDFEAAPPMAAWDNIEKELDGKKPAALIPLWIKWVGIAAGIALLATIAYTGYTSSSNDSNTNQQIVIDSQDTDDINSNNPSNTQIAIDENSSESNSDSENESSSSMNENIATSSNDNTLISDSHKATNNVNRGNQNSNPSSQESYTRANGKSKTPSYIKDTSPSNQKNVDKEYASNRSKKNQGNLQPSHPPQSDFSINQSVGNTVAQEEILNNSDSQTPNSKRNGSDKTPQFSTPSASNTDIGLAAQVENDSTSRTQPSLEDMAAQQKDKEEDEKVDALPFKKWNASSVLAPVYSSTMGGSSINQQFVDNKKAAGVNLSYGVNVGYNLSKRLSVRTGVHKVSMSYTTNDIIYGNPSQPGDIQLLSVDNFDASAVSNPGGATSSNLGSSFSQEFLSDNTFNGFQGEISQRLGYLEVPVELKYKVLDSKLSVSVMGGMSALFLTDNSIAVTNSTAKLELGEDANFNSFNQSANFGIGIDYLFTDQLGITVEPMFKYQLNALRENTAGFRPFNVGVYSGITYKF